MALELGTCWRVTHIHGALETGPAGVLLNLSFFMESNDIGASRSLIRSGSYVAVPSVELYFIEMI